jgi:hypothetical protein
MLEEELSLARTLAAAEGEVTKVILEQGHAHRKSAAETMPSTFPLVIRCLSRSSLEKLSIRSVASIHKVGISILCQENERTE